MPLFEFECVECEKTFGNLVRSSENINSVICPFCSSDMTRKKISTFATRVIWPTISSAPSSGYSTSSCSTGSP